MRNNEENDENIGAFSRRNQFQEEEMDRQRDFMESVAINLHKGFMPQDFPGMIGSPSMHFGKKY